MYVVHQQSVAWEVGVEPFLLAVLHDEVVTVGGRVDAVHVVTVASLGDGDRLRVCEGGGCRPFIDVGCGVGTVACRRAPVVVPGPTRHDVPFPKSWILSTASFIVCVIVVGCTEHMPQLMADDAYAGEVRSEVTSQLR